MNEVKRFNEGKYALKIEEVDLSNFSEDLRDWLVRKSSTTGELSWVLAYLDTQVVWGKIEDEMLTLSMDTPDLAVKLDAQSLQTLHLFGEKAEIRVWRDEAACFKARCLTEEPYEKHIAFDRDYLLWGTQAQRGTTALSGFTALQEGAQGLPQVLPVNVPASKISGHPVQLRVRNYLTPDLSSGQAEITASRLVALLAPEGGK